MNILFVMEHNATSANYNIAQKLINKILEKHNVFAAFYYKNGGFETGEYGYLDDYFFVQNTKKIEKELIKKNAGWNKWGKREKCFYLLSHPSFIFLCILNRINTPLKNKYYARRIDNYCRLKNIDCIIGVVCPVEIMKLIPLIRYCQNKYCIQLDPFTFNEAISKPSKKKRFDIEAKMFNSVKQLFTTDLIIKDLVAAQPYKDNLSKITTIEFPEIDEIITKEKEEKLIIEKKKQDEILFLHAGFFYNDIRNPKILVELFSILPSNYILCVAGANTREIMVYQNILGDRLRDYGLLSQEEARMARENVDYLISFNNLVRNQVPSKLFECIDCGKPFLNICQLRECPTLKYVRDYEMAYTLFVGDFKKQKDDLLEFIKNTKGKRIDKGTIINIFKECTVEYVANQLTSEIEKIV